MSTLNDDVIHLILSSDALRAHMWVQLDKGRKSYWTNHRYQHMIAESSIFYRVRGGHRTFTHIDERKRFLICYYAECFGKRAEISRYEMITHDDTCICKGNRDQIDNNGKTHLCAELQERLRVY